MLIKFDLIFFQFNHVDVKNNVNNNIHLLLNTLRFNQN